MGMGLQAQGTSGAKAQWLRNGGRPVGGWSGGSPGTEQMASCSPCRYLGLI